jgi:CubicO group peptidase (beta-lactamase class C family)
LFQDYVQMTQLSRDQTAFAVGLSPSEAPGERWVYHNGGVQVLEALFRGATGMTIEEYAESHLWSRIGMSATWAHDNSGHPTTYANVLATCRDHARLGYLYLHSGRWAGVEVVSEAWVREALSPSQPMNRAYGFLFWLNGQTPALSATMEPYPDMLVPYAPPDLFAARGFGNQFIDVIPSLDLIVVRFGRDLLSTLDLSQIQIDARFDKHDAILRPVLDAIRD